MALNTSPELNEYLLKAGHFPGDTWGGHFWTKSVG